MLEYGRANLMPDDCRETPKADRESFLFRVATLEQNTLTPVRQNRDVAIMLYFCRAYFDKLLRHCRGRHHLSFCDG